MKVLVTGGAGYIGSHTVLSLLEHNIQVLVFDNLVNSSIESLKRVEQLTGKTVEFVAGDIRDTAALERVFQQHELSSVIVIVCCVVQVSSSPLMIVT